MDRKSEPSPWAPEATPTFWINRTSRLLLRRLDAELRPFGFAMSQLPVLRALSQAPSLSQRELAEAAHVEQPTMTEMVARMERDGVVERTPNPRDKRGNLISLTRQARARFPKARAALVAAEREAMAGFSESEQATLRALLQRMAANLERDCGEPTAGAPP